MSKGIFIKKRFIKIKTFFELVKIKLSHESYSAPKSRLIICAQNFVLYLTELIKKQKKLSKTYK